MVKHIVLFRLRDNVSIEKKLVVMNSFKEAIEASPAKISVIHKIGVGLNMSPGETWDIALYSELDNLDDIGFYTTYLEYVTTSKTLVEAKESRACVNYEFQLQKMIAI